MDETRKLSIFNEFSLEHRGIEKVYFSKSNNKNEKEKWGVDDCCTCCFCIAALPIILYCGYEILDSCCHISSGIADCVGDFGVENSCGLCCANEILAYCCQDVFCIIW